MAEITDDAQVTCAAAPVQIEGTLTDGRHYNFRSRHQIAVLGVGITPDEAVDASTGEPEGCYVERHLLHLGPSGAGFISEAEARRLLVEMAAELPGATPALDAQAACQGGELPMGKARPGS